MNNKRLGFGSNDGSISYEQNPTQSSKARPITEDQKYSYASFADFPLESAAGTKGYGSDDDACYSVSPEGSDDICYPKDSISFGAGSPTFYEYNLPAYQHHPPSKQSYSSRATPSSLGWTSDTTFLNFYKFVVPKGKEPYFELLKGCYIPLDTPEKVFLDPPDSSRKNEFPCLYPGVCDEKIYKRPADLERHYRNAHGGPDQKEQFLCDYPPCKARGAFTRKDHARDHLRDYHKEDIGSAKREKRSNGQLDEKKWVKLQEAWIAERKIVANWWRCPKCLQRVYIADSGYKCQDCNTPCDGERVDRIEQVRQKSAETLTTSKVGSYDFQYGTTAAYSTNCSSCSDTGWVSTKLNRTGWEACQNCQPPDEHYYKVDDTWDTATTSYASNSRY